MKLILIAMSLFTLYRPLAWAFPAKGDYVRYEAPYEGHPVIIEKEILDDLEEQNQFLIKTTTTYQGQVLRELIYPEDKFYTLTPQKIESILKHCVEREGARGTYTIGSQTVDVCESYNEDSQLTQMVGMVPFGMIRFQIYLEEEEFLDFYLTQFRQSR
jgi:hypothetical protein